MGAGPRRPGFFNTFSEEYKIRRSIVVIQSEDKAYSQGRSKRGLNLIVCNTIESSVVYMNVEEDGLRDKHWLVGSEAYNACLCACAADISMTGHKQILLGTYGQKILIYNWKKGWKQSGLRSTANPVHVLKYVDLVGDGTCQLVILTLSGVNILQHDPDKVCGTFLTRLERIVRGARSTENQPHEQLDPTEIDTRKEN